MSIGTSGRGTTKLAGAALASALIAVAAQPSTAQTDHDLRRYGWTPEAAQARSCTWTPRRLPMLTAVVDSAALLQTVGAIGGFAEAEGHFVASVWFDTTGVVSNVYPIESSFDADWEVDLAAAVAANVRSVSTRFSRLRVGVVAGSAPAVIIGPSLECPPLFNNRAEIGRRLAAMAEQRGRRQGVTELWIFVHPDGIPGEVKIQKHSGDPDMDIAIVGVAKQMRFLPARVDGIPLGVWVAIPFSRTVR